MSIATLTRDPDAIREEDPDRDLVDALRRCDEGAYLTLLHRHSPLMLRVARGYVAHDLAEDVVQDAWIAVLRSIEGFGHRALFKTWLMRILVNTACSRRARELRTVSWSSLPEDAPLWDAVLQADPCGPERRALAGEAWATVRAALDTLPDRQRTVVVLRDVEGWTAEEVSSALLISAGNQRVLLHRGRARMRVLLLPYLDDELLEEPELPRPRDRLSA